jgi:hypothetical protein
LFCSESGQPGLWLHDASRNEEVMWRNGRHQTAESALVASLCSECSRLMFGFRPSVGPIHMVNCSTLGVAMFFTECCRQQSIGAAGRCTRQHPAPELIAIVRLASADRCDTASFVLLRLILVRLMRSTQCRNGKALRGTVAPSKCIDSTEVGVPDQASQRRSGK